MSSLISTTTPLPAGATYTSAVLPLTRATYITGTVFADTGGKLFIDQSGDGVHFDLTDTYVVVGNDGLKVETDVISQFFRVRFVNGNTPQTALRLFIDIRDPYGDFLVAQSAPSAGGAWLALFKDPARGYVVVGRFDGTDGWNVNGNAAVTNHQNGQYASVPVSDFVVTVETLQTTTDHTPASF